MKFYKYILLLGLFSITSCTSQVDYSINSNFKTIIENKNCEISFHYPEIRSPNQEFKQVNELLEKLPDYSYHANNCEESRFSKNKITGNYEVLLQLPERLSIQYTKHFHRDNKRKIDTMISGIVINPIEFEKGESNENVVTINSIIPNFKRGMLYKYVKEYNKIEQANINLKAYEEESNYHINWAVTNENLILYLGSEGEFFGNSKIEIPIKKLIEENDL